MDKYINKVIQGDCLEKLKELGDNSVDSIVTDPPYELGFMGKSWDNTGIANNKDMWAECLRVLKPGGYLLSFGGTRTYHRMACAIEDAGFEVRDMIEWVYGSGFPKSLNIGKAVDKLNGRNTELYNAVGLYIKEQRNKKGYTLDDINKFCNRASIAALWESQTSEWVRLPTMKDWFILKEKLELDDRFDYVIEREEKEREKVGEKDVGYVSQDGAFNETSCGFKKGTIDITKGTSEWEGWGTALKPAHEPICMARKPLSEKTVAENVLKWGTGGINIDRSRVGTEEITIHGYKGDSYSQSYKENGTKPELNEYKQVTGRFPANLIHDNSEEVRECFPETKSGGGNKATKTAETFLGTGFGGTDNSVWECDSGNASRFFKSIIYTAKASKGERNKGCEELEEKVSGHRSNFRCQLCGYQKASGTPCKCKNPVWEEIPLKPQSNNHPTVKPIALMEYLINMVTPKGGIVLDPFVGSGSTLVASKQNGFQYIGIEMTEEYIPIIEARLKAVVLENKLF